MPVTINLKKIVDLPVWQYIRYLPVPSAAGHCITTDLRGTHRYIYFMCGTASFWRYDTWTDTFQQLASPGALGGSGTWGAGTCMIFDPSRGTAGYIWLLNGYTTNPGFGYYDIAANTWTSRATPITTAWGTDGALAHTCSAYLPTANDDYIYLIGNNATTLYRYSISGNSWISTLTAAPAAMGGGCSFDWVYNFNADRIYGFRGGGTTTLYYYSISGNSWTTVTYQPVFETFTTGSMTAYCPDNNRIYIEKDNTHRFFSFDLANSLLIPAGTAPFTGGTAISGDGLAYIKTEDDLKFLYFRRHSSVEFWRTLIYWE